MGKNKLLVNSFGTAKICLVFWCGEMLDFNIAKINSYIFNDSYISYGFLHALHAIGL